MKARPYLLLTALSLLATVVAVGCADEAPPDTTGAATADQAHNGGRYREQFFLDVTVDRDVQYGVAPDLQDQLPMALTLDLYQPAADSAERRAAIIWVHGGGFAGGDKAHQLAAMTARQFAQLGYVAASVNYRLLDGPSCNSRNISNSCFNAAVEAVHDAQAAVRWLRANADTYRIDAERIAIAGESAGAIVASGVGVASDFAVAGNNPEFPSNVRAWISISGGLPEGIFVDSTDSPGLLFAGTRDKVVPYQWSVETADAMRAAGVTAVLQRLEGAGHVPWGEYGEFFQQESRAFLYTHLDLDGADR
jgi:acetyl esterase/lipase